MKRLFKCPSFIEIVINNIIFIRFWNILHSGKSVITLKTVVKPHSFTLPGF